MRWGVRVRRADDGPGWARLAQAVEAHGFDTLVMPDHPANPREFAPVPALMAAADATKTLRVSAMVFGNDFRNLLMLAKEMTTIDAISGGRVDVGLGAGWSEEDYAAVGRPFDPAGERIGRLEEAVGVLRRLFTEERVDHEGPHYHLRGARLLPRPTQRPHPPLVVGGSGPRVLAIAARQADIVSIGVPPLVRSASEVDMAALDARIGAVRVAAGERFARLTLHIQSDIRVTANAAEEYAKTGAQLGLDAEGLRASPHFIYGGLETVAQRLVELRARGIGYLRVAEDHMDAVAPLLSRI